MHTVTSNSLEPRPCRPRHELAYRQIVNRIEDLARAQTEEPLRVDDLCHTAGVSQRTLRKAFRAVHGSPPYRYLRTLRMIEARKALLSPAGPGQTVTEVAMRFGFLELGRFSVEYRQAFGERPSATMRRAMGAIYDVKSSATI